MSEDFVAPNQRRNAIWIIIAITVAMGLAAFFVVRMSRSHAGGPGELLLGAVFGEDTSYASGYTERGFIDLELGSDEATVLAILGEPLRRGRRKSAASTGTTRRVRIPEIIVCGSFASKTGR